MAKKQNLIISMWLHLIKALPLVLVLMALTAIGVWAGTVDSPGAPGSTNSFTLEDIYNRINTGETSTQSTFTEPDKGPGTGGTMHTLNEIYNLVGKRSPIPKTGQTIMYSTGDDGNREKGVSWPTPRFTNNNDGTVTDNLTGLIWLKNTNCMSGPTNFDNAHLFAVNLYDGTTGTYSNGGGDCGLSDNSVWGDWRVPNVREMFSLIDFSTYDPSLPSNYSTYFTGVTLNGYWTSTTDPQHSILAGFLHLGSFYNADGSGRVYLQTTQKSSLHYVWPVRGGQ